MALFQKKPQVSSSAPLYTLGVHKTLLIIGLGNPGREYEGTRHNIGFDVLDGFAGHNDFPGWVNKKDLDCSLTTANLGDSRIILCKPATYVNNSGQAAQAVQRFYRIYNHDTLAVYDELAIGFGQLRTRMGGSDAGHNGVKSLLAHIGADFGRLRIGIGPVPARVDPADYVLSNFTAEERKLLPSVVREAEAMLTEYIFGSELPHDTRSVA